MTRRVEVLVETCERLELLVADIALEAGTIPGSARGFVGCISMPLKQLVGYNAAGVTATKLRVYRVAI
jgi:hypothetical protein